MCILSYLPPHVDVDERGLYNGGVINGDGHGWAIVAGDRIIRERSMNLDDAIDSFTEARGQHMSGPALFHSRWMTHGKWSINNVHPFYVGYSDKTVVAHNGILPAAAHPAKGDKRSDTRKFADEILPFKYARLDKPGVQKALHQFCGAGNKLVILTVDPRYQSNAYIINREAGEWDAHTGIWHSNGGYRTKPKAKSKAKVTVYRSDGKGGYTATEQDDFTPFKSAGDSAQVFESLKFCEFCQEGVVELSGYCVACGSCAHCLEWVGDCECYDDIVPADICSGEVPAVA
jgi:glutamine amidotransferase